MSASLAPITGTARWTDEREARLRELHRTGMPFSKMAVEISKLPGQTITRNAAIGKAARLGLVCEAGRRVSNNRIERQARPPREPRPPKVIKPRPVSNLTAYNAAAKADKDARRPRWSLPPAHEFDPSLARPWIEREYGQCAYPVSGEGADVMSCCASTNDATYCPAHASLMFVKPNGTPRNLVKTVFHNTGSKKAWAA